MDSINEYIRELSRNGYSIEIEKLNLMCQVENPVDRSKGVSRVVKFTCPIPQTNYSPTDNLNEWIKNLKKSKKTRKLPITDSRLFYTVQESESGIKFSILDIV